MEKIEYKTELVEKKVPIKKEIICDVCNTRITRSYWHLITQHSDWGRDSIESIESFDLCSHACVNDKLWEYLEKSSNDYNSEEFNLEHINYSIPDTITGILKAGETELILNNEYIIENTKGTISVSSKYGIPHNTCPTTVTVLDGSITLTFNAQEEDMIVTFRFKENNYE